MLKILIADDHAVVRKGIEQIIAETPDLTVTASVSHGQAVMDYLREHAVDVVIMDIKMPGLSGLHVLPMIKKEYPHVAVLILTIFPEEQYAIRAMQLGASGYLTKESAPEKLLYAIRKAAAGGKYIGESLAEKLADFVKHDVYENPHEQLSAREYEVFCALAAGKTVTQIADELNLSVKTISTYRKRIMQKFGMKSNDQLTQYALQHDLIYK